MRNFWLIILAAVLAAGCRTSNPSSAAKSSQPLPYTRIVTSPDSNVVQLQITFRKMVPSRRGPVIWLASTMHVGEPAYYKSVQKFLDAQTVVLYEGVNTDSHPRHASETAHADLKTETETNSANSGFSLQSALADSLGLVFQLNAIDYDRTNFLNSDLSIAEIQQLMIGSNAVPAPPGQGTPANPSFSALLQIMDGSSFLGALFKAGLQFIGSDPKFQGLAKLTLIESIGRLKGDLSDLRDVPPDWKQLLKVLIAARNEHVVGDLKAELKKVPRKGTIAIFYGTGHMDDMERRLERELDYHPAGDEWLTAFSVDLRKSGISPAEAMMTRNMIKWQLDQMK